MCASGLARTKSMKTDVRFKGTAQAPTDPQGPTGRLAEWLQRLHLLAGIAGCGAGTRAGMSLAGAQMLSRGWHSASVSGTHASAAAAGMLVDLDPAGFEDALGLAATQSAGLMAAQLEAMCKRMHHR